VSPGSAFGSSAADHAALPASYEACLDVVCRERRRSFGDHRLRLASERGDVLAQPSEHSEGAVVPEASDCLGGTGVVRVSQDELAWREGCRLIGDRWRVKTIDDWLRDAVLEPEVLGRPVSDDDA
jgi:hypothetical protein